MSRHSVGDSVASLVALVVVIIVVFVAAIMFIVESTAEGAVWDGIGQAFGAAGLGGVQAAWGLLGLVLTIVAVVGFVLWAVGKVQHR